MPAPSGSVLFMDSPDSGESSKWSTYSVNSVASGVTPYGGDAYFIAGGGDVLRTGIPQTASVLAASLVRVPASSGINAFNGVHRYFSDNGTTIHISLTVSTAGAVVVRRGGGNDTEIASSSTGVIEYGSWHHWQSRVTVDNSSGRVEVWIDGTKVVDFTGDTRNGGTSTLIDSVEFRGANGRHESYHADLVVCDSTTPIGICRVVSLLPNAVGNSSDLTPSGGAVDNYTMVDEATPDGDTTYNASATEGDKDTYGMANMPTGAWSILGVQVSLNSKASDAGTKYLRPVLRIGGTDYTGASRQLGVDYQSLLTVFDDSPATATAFTEAEIDGMEVGAEVRDS